MWQRGQQADGLSVEMRKQREGERGKELDDIDGATDFYGFNFLGILQFFSCTVLVQRRRFYFILFFGLIYFYVLFFFSSFSFLKFFSDGLRKKIGCGERLGIGRRAKLSRARYDRFLGGEKGLF